MEHSVRAFVESIVAQIHPLWTAFAQAQWGLSTTGLEKFQQQVRYLNAETRQLFAQADTWAHVRTFHSRRFDIEDIELRRQIEALYREYARNQCAPDQIDQIASLETDLESLYTTFRSSIGGQKVSENAIKDVLRHELDVSARREAWEASKQIGAVATQPLLELVELRNANARALGWRDHYVKSLALEEIDEDELFTLLDSLEQQTREPFRNLKARLDQALADRFGISESELRPWHYSDPFFQEMPSVGSVNFDSVFAGQDIEALTIRTFDGLGLDVRDILARSDMYERPGKEQHAFCIHIDRTDDVRVLCNLRPNTRWMETSLHEFGHAIYDKYLASELPYLLREPAHTNTTEAIAMLMGRMTHNADWLCHVRGLPASQASDLALPAQEQERAKQLVFMRWGLVMVYFERDMYANPQRPDLNQRWWDYVERFQMLRRPEGRDAPDWAAKMHLAATPVYYHNYILGELTASQLTHAIKTRVPGRRLVDNPAAGKFLREQLLALGARHPWNDTLSYVTGERLNPRYFVEQFVGIRV